MKIWTNKTITKILICVVGLMGMVSGANAAVTYPALDIQVLSGDTGITSTATSFTIDATAFGIIDARGSFIDIPDQTFLLESDTNGAGTINVDSGSSLSASFSNLTVYYLGSGQGQFFADLDYLGGSLVSGLSTGRIEGGFAGATYDGTAGLIIPFGTVFTADTISAKLGQVQVVPVPAAVWLFGSGLLGLAGITRRKKAA